MLVKKSDIYSNFPEDVIEEDFCESSEEVDRKSIKMGEATRKRMRHIDGQEEIIKAIENDDVIGLWHLVKYIGYNKVRSINERKLIFLRTYREFDPATNDNFVAYYNKCIHYTMLNAFKTKTSVISCNKNAKKAIEERKLWPVLGENGNQKPKTQSENLLEKFIF